MAGDVVEALRGGLVVSVQAYEGEPMRHSETMARVAEACALGGAAGIRCQGPDDIREIRARVDVPVIGLWKIGHEGVYITPTLEGAVACADAGADIVALDATGRTRPDGRSFEETVRELRAARDVAVMADCMTLEDMRRAAECGCELVSTTLSFNKAAIDTTMAEGPDLALVRQAVRELADVPVVCEGHVHTPADAAAAIKAGAWAVVVGTAITHPTSITRWFCEAVRYAG